MKSVVVGLIAGALLFVAPPALLIIAFLWLIQSRPQLMLVHAFEDDSGDEAAIDESPNVIRFPAV